MGVLLTPGLEKIWEATAQDCEEGSCLGLVWSQDEVPGFLGDPARAPTQRFEVHQKNKVRGCDSAIVNIVNNVTKVTEKLHLPSTDAIVAALRK